MTLKPTWWQQQSWNYQLHFASKKTDVKCSCQSHIAIRIHFITLQYPINELSNKVLWINISWAQRGVPLQDIWYSNLRAKTARFPIVCVMYIKQKRNLLGLQLKLYHWYQWVYDNILEHKSRLVLQQKCIENQSGKNPGRWDIKRKGFVRVTAHLLPLSPRSRRLSPH